MDDKLKTMSFKDFTVVNPSMTDDEYLAYQAQKRRRGHFDTQGESVEHALGTVEEKTLHINLDAKDSPRQKQVTSVLKRHEKSGAIEFDGETDKGALFKINKPGVEKSINKELSKLGGGYQLGESVEQVDEVMSISQRKKAGQRMKRMSKRIQVAKKRAMKRAPTMDVLQKRAQKTARSNMIKKWSRGQEKSDMSPGRRGEMEKRLKKSKGKIDRMAKRLVPQLRKVDRERRSSTGPTDTDKK
jgi:hypothetical protein